MFRKRKQGRDPDRLAPGRKPQFLTFNQTLPIRSKPCAPDVRVHRSGDSHTLFAQLQPTIWGRISVIAAQLAPAHFLYQLCADIVVAVIQTSIIFLLQMLFITDTRGLEYNPARLLLAQPVKLARGELNPPQTTTTKIQKLIYFRNLDYFADTGASGQLKMMSGCFFLKIYLFIFLNKCRTILISGFLNCDQI